MPVPQVLLAHASSNCEQEEYGRVRRCGCYIVSYPRSQGEGKPGYEARGDTLMVGHGTVYVDMYFVPFPGSLEDDLGMRLTCTTQADWPI